MPREYQGQRRIRRTIYFVTTMLKVWQIFLVCLSGCHSSFFCKWCPAFFGEPVTHQIIFFLFSSGRADNIPQIQNGQCNKFLGHNSRMGKWVACVLLRGQLRKMLSLYHWTGNWKDIKPASAGAHSIRKILQSIKLTEKKTKLRDRKIEIYEDVVKGL